MDCRPPTQDGQEELGWRKLLSRKFIIGESAVAGIAFSSQLHLSEVALYGLTLIALVAVGFTGWADLARVWCSIKPASIMGAILGDKPVTRTRP